MDKKTKIRKFILVRLIFGYILIPMSFIFAIVFVDLLPKITQYYDHNSYVYFLSVGNADAILIKDQSQKLILIDGGSDSQVQYRLDQVLPFWVNRIDIVFVTHPHFDHYGGLGDILQKYTVDCMFYEHIDKTPNQSLRVFNQNIMQYVDINKVYDRLKYDKFVVECLADIKNRLVIVNELPVGKQKNPNNYSIVLHYQLGKISVLLMADAEYKIQSEITTEITSAAINIIKVPHQGSKDALNMELLDRINSYGSKNIAVFSVGANSYGHPHKNVVKTYDMLDFRVYRLDFDGNIICSELFDEICVKQKTL